VLSGDVRDGYWLLELPPRPHAAQRDNDHRGIFLDSWIVSWDFVGHLGAEPNIIATRRFILPAAHFQVVI